VKKRKQKVSLVMVHILYM